MRERVLEVALEEAIDLFQGIKWKFWETCEKGENSIVRIEVPRGSSECLVVEIPFANEQQLKQIEAKLRMNGFVKQSIRVVSDF